MLCPGPDAARDGATSVQGPPPPYGDDPRLGCYRKHRPEETARGRATQRPRGSVLDPVRRVVHEVEDENDRGRKTDKRVLIFPRYQLDCVRRLVGHAWGHGTGQRCQRYLHSAGSGRSFTIGWSAHRLSVLHDADDRRILTRWW